MLFVLSRLQDRKMDNGHLLLLSIYSNWVRYLGGVAAAMSGFSPFEKSCLPSAFFKNETGNVFLVADMSEAPKAWVREHPLE